MTATPNKALALPAHGSNVNTWDVPLNANATAIDTAFGGSASISVTSASGTVALTSAQYTPPNITFTGTLTANVNYQLPSGVGGFWSVLNSATGAFTVTFSSAAGGATVVAPVGLRVWVICDGTSVGVQTGVGAAGSNTQVQYNSNGFFGASSALTWDGTNLAATNFTGAIGTVTPQAGAFTAVTGAVDATLHGLTVGQGLGSVATNTAVGASALAANTTGSSNTATGANALVANTTGAGNTAFGAAALDDNTAGAGNTAVGVGALGFNSTGSDNTAAGYGSLEANTTGNGNTAFGYSAAQSITSGVANSAFGTVALFACTTAAYNTAIGDFALGNCTSGANNFALGKNSGTDSVQNVVTGSNIGVIGNETTAHIYAKVALTVTSDERDKTPFVPIPHGLEFVHALSPGMFQLINRRSGDPVSGFRYGFSAQEVLGQEEGAPVVVDASDPENLKLNEAMLVPILWNAVKELACRVSALELYVLGADSSD